MSVEQLEEYHKLLDILDPGLIEKKLLSLAGDSEEDIDGIKDLINIFSNMRNLIIILIARTKKDSLQLEETDFLSKIMRDILKFKQEENPSMVKDRLTKKETMDDEIKLLMAYFKKYTMKQTKEIIEDSFRLSLHLAVLSAADAETFWRIHETRLRLEEGVEPIVKSISKPYQSSYKTEYQLQQGP